MFLAPTIKKPKENQCFTPWRPMGSPWGAHGAPQGIQDAFGDLLGPDGFTLEARGATKRSQQRTRSPQGFDDV